MIDFNSKKISAFVSKRFFDEQIILNKDPSWPKISVITPSRNQAEFLERTILSVLNQNYPNLEYIIIDGGSTDGSVEIIRKYEKFLTYWVSGKDKGQADAINKGFKMAGGTVFAWLNADDVYLPDAMRNAAEFFKIDSEAGMCYGKAYLINETDDTIGAYPTEDFDFKRLAGFNFIAQPSVFFKREVYFAAGCLDSDMHYAADYDLWIRIAKTYKVRYLPVSLSTYRLHAGSKTVSEESALDVQRECLKTVMKHYGWVPPNRAYGYCYHNLRVKMPSFIVKTRPLMLFLSILTAAAEYLRLNKGVRPGDIKMINPLNIKKLLRGWEFRDLIK